MESTKKLATYLLIRGTVLTIGLFYAGLVAVLLLFRRFTRGPEFFNVKERTLPPLCLQDTAYGRHSYIRLKDVKIHYVENGDRSKPLVLFVHGYPEFWFSWRRQLKHFGKDYWAVAFDLRGYGESDKPSKVSAYNMENLEQDIVQLVKALGREKCILVAHDWGGAISWNVAAKYPQHIEKLVILNAPHFAAFRKKILSSPFQFLKSWYMFFFQIPFLPEISARTDDLNIFKRMFGKSISDQDLEAYKYTWARKGAWTPPMNYYRNIFTVTAAALPMIEMPTLIIWGEDDIALEKDLAEMSKEYVRDARVLYIPGSHFIQHDKPEEVNRAIEQFIS